MTVRISQRRVDMNGVQLRLSKGADVASATALVLGSDGNYFDVTGTTTITSIGAITTGTVIRLHFDSALTLTHNATNLILPGAANITTATGDHATFVEYATGDWRCTNYTKASGEAVVGGGGGAWDLIGTVTASNSASLTITGLDSLHDIYALYFSDLLPQTNFTDAWLRFGDSAGIDSGASDYGWTASGALINNTTWIANTGKEDYDDSKILIGGSVGIGQIGNETDEGFGGMLTMTSPSDTANQPGVSGQTHWVGESIGTFSGGQIYGWRKNNIAIDRIQFLFSSGNIVSGRLTILGLKHV